MSGGLEQWHNWWCYSIQLVVPWTKRMIWRTREELEGLKYQIDGPRS